MQLSGDPGADPGTAEQTGEAGGAGRGEAAGPSLCSPFTSRLQAASIAGEQRAKKPPGLVTFSPVSASELKNCS